MTYGHFSPTFAPGTTSTIASGGTAATRQRLLWCDRLGRNTGRGDPAIAAATDRLDKHGILGGIPESFPPTIDCTGDTAVEVDENIIRPERHTKIFPAKNFVGTAEQELKRLERQLLNLDLSAFLAQFARALRRRLSRAARSSWLRFLPVHTPELSRSRSARPLSPV